MNICEDIQVVVLCSRSLSKLRQASCEGDVEARSLAKARVLFKASSLSRIQYAHSYLLVSASHNDQGRLLFPVGVVSKGSEYLQNIIQPTPIKHTDLANVRGSEDRPRIPLVFRS